MIPPFPAGHGTQPGSAVCLCGVALLACPPMQDWAARHPARGACAGRRYLERGTPVLVIRGWRGPGPRNVLIQRSDGSCVVRPFRGLRRHP